MITLVTAEAKRFTAEHAEDTEFKENTSARELTR
jgi:hypothetical protein